jgi:hypothetical protein
MAEDLAAARAHWVSLGLSAEDFDRASGVVAAPAAAPPSPEPSPEPTSTPGEAGRTARPYQQAADAARHLAAHGTPVAAIQQALGEEGFTSAQVSEMLKGYEPDANPEIEELRQAGMTGAASDQYQIRYDPESIAGFAKNPAALAELDRDVRTAMAEMEVPAGVGSDLGRIIVKAAADYQRLSGADREAYERRQVGDLVRVLGPQGAIEADRLVTEAIGRVSNKTFASDFLASGAIHSTELVVHLAQALKMSEVRGAIRSGVTLGAIAEALR